MIRMTRWSVSIQSSLTPLYGTLLFAFGLGAAMMITFTSSASRYLYALFVLPWDSFGSRSFYGSMQTCDLGRKCQIVEYLHYRRAVRFDIQPYSGSWSPVQA